MKQWKRFLLQAFLWLIVWVILVAGRDFNLNYIINNALAFIFQLALIAGLIFYGAKTLLFKKRYFLFTLISIVSIVFCAQLSSSFGQRERRSLQDDVIHMQEGPPIRFESNKPDQLPPNGKPILPPAGPPMFFIHLLMLSISFILAAFIEAFLFAKRKEEEHLLAETEHLQTELKLLKTQINPHFLFNSLNNIYALAAIDSDKTQESISYLSNMLRYVLYECELPKVFLKKEIDYIKNYIKLFSLKSSKKYNINTNYHITNELASVAPMIFIPFIENALKHSHIEKGNGAFIQITIKADHEQIELIVANSKPEQAIQKDEVGGIGLENVKKRLAILYPDSYKLNMEESEETFSVDLLIKI